MFGSAKYRSYEYGADDHVAVVHTEKLKEDAAMYVSYSLFFRLLHRRHSPNAPVLV